MIKSRQEILQEMVDIYNQYPAITIAYISNGNQKTAKKFRDAQITLREVIKNVERGHSPEIYDFWNYTARLSIQLADIMKSELEMFKYLGQQFHIIPSEERKMLAYSLIKMHAEPIREYNEYLKQQHESPDNELDRILLSGDFLKDYDQYIKMIDESANMIADICKIYKGDSIND